MAFSIATLARSFFGSRPEVVCPADVWQRGTAELRKRTGGKHESGAFLLGKTGKPRRIEEFVFYDDIDSDAYKTGIVVIDGRKLGALWDHCRKTGREVVADVHVHPGGFGQSKSDRANPIIAEVGHIAFILPNYAAGTNRPGEIGVYRYLGSRKWHDNSRSRPSSLHVGWWPQWR
jgi:proteasome lid subunit RPN8/RPN11